MAAITGYSIRRIGSPTTTLEHVAYAVTAAGTYRAAPDTAAAAIRVTSQTPTKMAAPSYAAKRAAGAAARTRVDRNLATLKAPVSQVPLQVTSVIRNAAGDHFNIIFTARL